MKRASIFIMILIVVASIALTGCRTTQNSNVTELMIGVYDGGIGADWIYSIKKSFEDRYKDVSFEPGKTGVRLEIYKSREYTNDSLKETLSDLPEDIIFGEAVFYSDLANRNLLLDITDVVNESISYDFVTTQNDSNREDVSIKDKMRGDLVPFYEIDSKFYGLPLGESNYGIIYDIELFDDYLLYFAPDGGFVTSLDAPRSAGPDGNPSTTHDNGLPATYDDFFRLCDKIVSIDVEGGIVPIMWGGTVQEYVSSLLMALTADFEGAQQMKLNYDYDGYANNIVTGFDSKGKPIISPNPVKITAKDGYKLYSQLGRYHALTFLERLVSNKNYYNSNNAISNIFSHTDAQDHYISAKYMGSIKRSAMLIDGSWWQSESKNTFNDLAAEYGYEASAAGRKFGIMPLPKVSQEYLGDYTILELGTTFGFINGAIAENKIDLAKSFLQYCFSNEVLLSFTKDTNFFRPYIYDVSDEYLNSLSSWGRALYNQHLNAERVSMDSHSLIARNYSMDLIWSPMLWKSIPSTVTYTYPSFAMINDKVSAKDYFTGMSKYWTPSVWSNKFVGV